MATLAFSILSLVVGLLVAVPAATVSAQAAFCPRDLNPCATLETVVARNPSTDLETISTIVVTGAKLPVAPREIIGKPVQEFADVTAAGWRIGGFNGFGDCSIVIGESTSRRLVIAVGNIGALCTGGRYIDPGNQVVVTVSGPDGRGFTVSGTAVAPRALYVEEWHSGKYLPSVTAVIPPYGSQDGASGYPGARDPSEAVTVRTVGVKDPQAFWFGGSSTTVAGGITGLIGADDWYGVASTDFAPHPTIADAWVVYPPAFVYGGVTGNYSTSAFAADASTGMTQQDCTFIILGCENAYLYLDSNESQTPEIDLAPLSISTGKSYDFPGGAPSPACGLDFGQEQSGVSASISVAAAIEGRVKASGGYGVSKSNSEIPQAVVGTGTLTVLEPISFSLTLTAQASGCLELPLPGLTIPNVGGLYVVIGAKIEGTLKAEITVAKGTYSFSGGFVPPIGTRSDTGAFGTSDFRCFDDDDQALDRCISTRVTAGVRGTLTISPLWLQIATPDEIGGVPLPIQVTVGVGLTAAVVVDATVELSTWPPTATFGWNVCASLRWVAGVAVSVKIPGVNEPWSYDKSTGGNLFGPLNIYGQGNLCPFGDSGTAPPPPPAAVVSPSNSRVVASETSVPADGVASSTVTVTLQTVDGAAVAGRVVGLSTDGGSSTVSAASGPSDTNGVVTFTVRNSTAETVNYSAFETIGYVTLDQTAEVAFTTPNDGGGGGGGSTGDGSGGSTGGDGSTNGGSGAGSTGGGPTGGGDAGGAGAGGGDDFEGHTAFVSLSPARLLDTRPGEVTIDEQFSGVGLAEAGSVTELVVTGRAGIATDASAVVLNVTITEPQAPGFVTVFPCGTERPTASNLNYAAGQTIANLVLAKVGDHGAVCLFTRSAAHLVADLKDGYFPADADYHAIDPDRFLDTRQTDDVDAARLHRGLRAAESVTELTVAGVGDVPFDAASVVLNVTVDQTRAPGFVTVFPCGTERPTASNLNYQPGDTIPNTVVAKVGNEGKVCIFTKSPIELIVDANGYFPDGSNFGSLPPVRLLDTRPGERTIDGESQGQGAVAAGGVVWLQVAGRAEIPADAAAVMLNVTATGPQGPGFIAAFPCDEERPTVSNLSYGTGQTIANSMLAKLSADGRVCLFSKAESDLVMDVSGYFAA